MILRKSQENGVLQVNMTNFGASFKQARESKGISLDQIASETRISTRFLRAIENEEFHLLPGGIFNRGFVRAYAEKIGIDPDQAVADYERLAEVRPPELMTEPERPAAGKKDRHLYSIAIGALLVVIAVFYVVTRESIHTAQTASTPPAVTAPSQPAATPNPVPAAPAPEVETPSTPPPPDTGPQTTAAAPEPAPQRPSPVPATAAAPTAPAALTLEVDAHDQTWIKVVVDGRVVDPSEILGSGMTRTFSAQNSITISVGNAGGLSLKVNDKPLKPLGKSGLVRQITITPNNLKDLTGT
ncbi:MAG TPA: RodZ domain-containing protein [Terriglobia bacterium]|jgi:cytoskeletal protein RodZ